MTKQLYYEDAYLKDFDAYVTDCREGADGMHLYLDKSAFFPEGGGQDGDRGYLFSICFPEGKRPLQIRKATAKIFMLYAVSKRRFPRGQECMAFWTGSSALTGCRIIPVNTS